MLLAVRALLSCCVLLAQPEPGAGVVEGHVFDALSRAPVRRAAVVLSASDAPIRLTAISDAEGKFQFLGLPPATYRLSASRAGYPERKNPKPIPLGLEGKVTDAEIRLLPEGSIAGRVLDEAGEPEAGADISVFRQVYRNGIRRLEHLTGTQTNDTGEYRAAHLKPGRYILQAYSSPPQADNHYGSPPKSWYVPVYYPNALTPEQAASVLIGPGTEIRGIDIQLVKVAMPPRVRIKGKVTGATAEATVQMARTDGGHFGGTVGTARAPDFAFELSVPPGQYRLNAHASELYGAANVTVAGDMEGITVSLQPMPDITGQVRVVEREAKVKLQDMRADITWRESGIVLTGRADASGRMAFKGLSPVNTYSIFRISAVPEDCYLQAVKIAGQEIDWDSFEITGSTQLEFVLSKTAAKIGGLAAGEGDKPLPGAAVALFPLEGKARPVKTQAGADGRYEFKNLRPGKYRVYAWEEVDEDLWQDPEFLRKYEGRAVEVTAGPGVAKSATVPVIVE